MILKNKIRIIFWSPGKDKKYLSSKYILKVQNILSNIWQTVQSTPIQFQIISIYEEKQ